MRKKSFLLLLALLAVSVICNALEISSVPADKPDIFKTTFTKYVDVFGLGVYGAADVPDEKVLHAAGVLAQYLDNDENGTADEANVLSAILSNNGCIVMWNDERSKSERTFWRKFPGGYEPQSLYGVETVIGYPTTTSEFDYALEEVLHLVTQWGYAEAYPAVFGEVEGSTVADFMDIARGGHFTKVPKNYPPEAWFTYDDRTCDYACQITEYIFWALTSILDGQELQCEDISEEWDLCTSALVQSTDGIYYLLTDPQWHFASVLPDGNYQQ